VSRWSLHRGRYRFDSCAVSSLLFSCLLLAGCSTNIPPMEGTYVDGKMVNLRAGQGGSGAASLTEALFGSAKKDGAIGKPPPGVVIIAAGDGASVDARVQVGAPVYSVTSTVQNTTPPGVLDSLAKWLAPDPPPEPYEPPPPPKVER
jgi:hypothetical protein